MTDQPQTITVDQAATLLGRSRRWIYNLVEGGFIQKAGSGKYTVVGVVRGAMAYYEDQIKKNQKTAAASRVTDARTREIELKIAQRQGQLIDREEHEALLELVTGRYLGALGGIPAQVSRDPTERERVERIIDQERERLADYFDEVADNIASVVDDDPAIEADDAARVGGNQ